MMQMLYAIAEVLLNRGVFATSLVEKERVFCIVVYSTNGYEH